MNIVFCGFSGKTGSILYKELEKTHTVYKVDINNPLEKEISKADIVIDFTNKKACFKHALICAKHKIPFISGSTGLNDLELEQIDAAFKKAKTSAFICSNFSLGMNYLIKDISHYSFYDDILIYETHHKSKLDTPSGTSLLLKKSLNKDVPIVSKRKNSYEVIHEIALNNEFEELIITHKVKNKKAYYLLLLKAIKEANTFIGLKTN